MKYVVRSRGPDREGIQRASYFSVTAESIHGMAKEADQGRGFRVIVVAQVEQCRGARRAEIPSPLPRHSAIQPAVGVVEVCGDGVVACRGENTDVGVVWGAGAF